MRFFALSQHHLFTHARNIEDVEDSMRTSVRIIGRSASQNRDCDASGVLPGRVGGWKGSGGPPHPVWLTQCDWDSPSVHVRGTWKDRETEGDQGGPMGVAAMGKENVMAERRPHATTL